MVVIYKRIIDNETYLNRWVGYNNNVTIAVNLIKIYEVEIWQGRN